MTEGLIQSRKDVRAAAQLLGKEEIRYLVKAYYQVQEFRKAANNMALAMKKLERPNELVSWLSKSQNVLEDDIKVALEVYAQNDPLGQWALSQHGIGPVLTAGLLSEIEVDRAPTAGNVWSFAGLNPAVEWKKGKKRPWNAQLKVLCWKIGDSFMHHAGSEKCVYGHIYKQRKELEIERNERGDFADQAAAILEKKKIKKPETLKVYKDGRLPKMQIELRARRVAVKLFLAHYLDVAHWFAKGKRTPEPYALAHMGHAHEIKVPNPPWPASAER